MAEICRRERAGRCGCLLPRSIMILRSETTVFTIATRISPCVLFGNLVPAEFQKRLVEPRVKSRGETPGGGFLGTDGCVAPKFGPESATLVTVHPHKESRVGRWRRAISHSVGPVLGESVILRGRRQTSARYRQSHRYIGSVAAHVISPQR